MGDAGDAVRKFRDSTEPARPVLTGWMIDNENAGNPKVSDRPGYVYVLVDRGEAQASGDVIEVWDNGFRPVAGWPVRVGTTRDRPWEYSILRVDQEAMGGAIDGIPTIGHHAAMHQWCDPTGGDDVVYPRFLQLYDFSVWPGGGLTVNVSDGIYEPYCVTRGLDYTNVDLNPYKPASGLRYVGINLSPTGTVEIVPGQIQSAALTLADVPPAPSADHWRLAAVRVRSTDTEIVHTCTQTNIVDLRFARLGWPVTLSADADANLLELDGCHQLDLDQQTAGQFFAADPTGTSKPFFRFITESDLPATYAPVVDSITVTVGAGNDFPTIQAAIDWFADQRVIYGDCIISPDMTNYDEAVVFEGLNLAAGATLTLRGDTRVLPGLSYVDGTEANPAGLANGGTFNDANRCTLATNVGLDQITVSGGTVDPDFDAGSLLPGNKILVYDESAGTVVERTIASISPAGAGNNVIEITVALAAALGGDGDAILLQPNRSISRSAAGPCITVNAVRGITIKGFYLETSTGAGCNGINAWEGAQVTVENCAARAEDFGFSAYRAYSTLVSEGGAISAWGCARGFVASTASQIYALYAVAVACPYGFQAGSFSLLNASYGIVTGSATRGYDCSVFSNLVATAATARQCAGTAYYAAYGGYLYANLTDGNNNGNAVDYNPAPAIPGSAQGNEFATIYAST